MYINHYFNEDSFKLSANYAAWPSSHRGFMAILNQFSSTAETTKDRSQCLVLRATCAGGCTLQMLTDCFALHRGDLGVEF
jgi:hypothetical protein